MPTIRIHVEHEELSAIKRRADSLGVSVAEVVYGALNCAMSHSHDYYCIDRIKDSTHEPRKDLPLWSDTARSVSIYEGKPDVAEKRGPRPAD
ncbi:MAG TPA: hypothetical protein VFE31_04980 [Opitutaceae bacterium]|jgi:hypothetical protein|nr:hypothetical protein [Opitutaceae bacterium]